MNRRLLVMPVFLFLVLLFLNSTGVGAQDRISPGTRGAFWYQLEKLAATPAVSGYESELTEKIRTELAALHPTTDNLGDVIVTIGSGAPHRLILTPIDEPGFVVSGITDDGYLRLQRLPQGGLPPVFNELYSAQPVKIRTTSGKWIEGVVAGVSVHLQPGRVNPPKSSDIENMYVDIGATSAADVRKAGVENLSPVVMNSPLAALGENKLTAPWIGDRLGAAALVELLTTIHPTNIKGTLTVAFVVQQRTGARGLQRILSTIAADEMIYVGRLLPGSVIPGMQSVRRAPRREPGSGVLLGLEETNGSLAGLAADLKQFADEHGIPLATDYSADLLPPSYLPAPAFPAKWAHVAVATSWPDTPVEEADVIDLAELTAFLDFYMEGTPSDWSMPERNGPDHAESSLHEQLPVRNTLWELTETYGASQHEGPVREAMKRLLPPWAKPETDDAGNLILHLGTAPSASKAPKIVVVAHLDEIGYVVKSISKDGRLEVETLGGFEPSFFLGHPALVHTAAGDRDAIMELPNGWDEPKFEWPRSAELPARVDVGARSPEEVEKLGAKVGDTITIPKAYRPLLGARAVGRSFDDRVGCTALISAVWSLSGPLKDRDVTFVWSTGEEIGLVGAAALAKRLAAEGRSPDYVFAIDTFVSSDSPLESKRFADAELGKGFVVRAVDNSNIVPRDLVERIVKLARTNQIPVQYGATGGGNDGAAFVRYGSVDVALGWPLRYAHSAAEVIDTRDVDSLSRIITVIARSW
jgi:putative aminopeptidase FrvX